MKTNTLYRTILSFAIASLAVACATDSTTELNPNQSGEGTTLYAAVADGVRVGFTENENAGEGETAISLTWLDGDSFSVYDESGDYVGDFTYNGDDNVSAASFTSEATLYSNQTYTAVYPASTAKTLKARDAEMTTTTTQVGGAMTHLSSVCKMRDEFTLDENITFTHEMAILTAYFTSNTEYKPESLKVTIAGEEYNVNFTNLEESSSYYTHLMVAPCVISEGTTSLDFELLDTNGGTIYSNSTSTSMSIESGVRYKLALEPDMYDFIFTADDLVQFAKSINNYADDESGSGSNAHMRARTAILFNDIDMEGETWMAGNNSYEIGRRAMSYFTGTFDGNGKTIKNLTITGNANNFGGLVGYLGHESMSSEYKPVVKNLTMESPKLEESCDTSAFVVGAAYNATIENCHVVGDASITIADGKGTIGGIAGSATNTTIQNSSVNCDSYTIANAVGATSGGVIGGVVGLLSGESSKMYNCYIDGKATIGEFTANSVAGVVGSLNGGVVEFCSARSADVVIDGRTSGQNNAGVVGLMAGSSARVYGSYNEATVYSSKYIGGVVGRNNEGGDIVLCYNLGSVYATQQGGGIVGNFTLAAQDVKLLSCYSVTTDEAVTDSNSYYGIYGLVKVTNYNYFIDECYYIGGKDKGNPTATGSTNTANCVLNYKGTGSDRDDSVTISTINAAVENMNARALEYDSAFKYQFVADGDDTTPTIVEI